MRGISSTLFARHSEVNASTTTWHRVVLALALVLAVGTFYALGLHRYVSWDYLRAHIDLLKRETAAHPLAVLTLFIGVYISVTALSLPVATALGLVAGVLFGRWLGTAVVSLAATAGATFAFLSSRYVLADWVQSHFGRQLGRVNRGVERDGGWYLLTLRLVPAFPFFVINIAAGLTALRVWTFAWVSMLGMLPGTFLYVNAGAALGGLVSPRDVLSPVVLGSLALLGLAPLVLRLLVRRWDNGRPPSPTAGASNQPFNLSAKRQTG